MISEPQYMGKATFRDYDDYIRGEIFRSGWNAAMDFVFGKNETGLIPCQQIRLLIDKQEDTE